MCGQYVHLIHSCCGGVRACVGLDGIVGRKYGGSAWVWGQNAAKEIWELLSALVMSRTRGRAREIERTDPCPFTECLPRGRFLSGGY